MLTATKGKFVDPTTILSYLNFGSSIASNALNIVTQLISIVGQFL